MKAYSNSNFNSWILKTTKICLSMCWVATKLTSKELSKNAMQFHWYSINVQRIMYDSTSFDNNIVWGYDCSILQLSKWIKIDMMAMHNLLKLGISIFLFSLKLAILYFITNNAKPFPPEFTLSHFCIKISLTQQTFPISIRSILFSLAVGYKVYLYSTNSEFSLLICFVSETREKETHNKTSWWHLLHHLNDVNPIKKNLVPKLWSIIIGFARLSWLLSVFSNKVNTRWESTDHMIRYGILIIQVSVFLRMAVNHDWQFNNLNEKSDSIKIHITSYLKHFWNEKHKNSVH